MANRPDPTRKTTPAGTEATRRNVPTRRNEAPATTRQQPRPPAPRPPAPRPSAPTPSAPTPSAPRPSEPRPSEPKISQSLESQEKQPEPPEKKPESIDESGSTESYNPFEHRNVRRPTSDTDSLAHLLKVSLGTGVLAMPLGVKHAGLVLGTVGSFLLGIMCTHCIQMLVRSSQTLCKRVRVPTLDYACTAETAFATGPKKMRKFSTFMKCLINLELILSFVMGNTVYVIFMSQTLMQVLHHDFDIGLSLRCYILMLWFPLILMCMFRTLKSLVPFSIIADLLMVSAFGVTLYYIFREINPTNSVKLVADPKEWPMFLCTVIFAIEGIGTVLPIENEMKNPQHFIGGKCGIVYVSMSIVTVLYTVIGFFGYLQYGDDVKGSITLSLPVTEVLAQVTKLVIGLVVFFTFALQYYVPINLVWDMIKNKLPERHHNCLNILLRVCMVSVTIILALIVPNLEPVISLVGSVCFSELGLLFPSLIDTMTRWPNMGWWKWRLVKNVLIMTLSLITLVAGSYSSILNIIEEYG